MHDPANELRRITLPRTPVNRASEVASGAKDECVRKHKVPCSTEFPTDSGYSSSRILFGLPGSNN
jgi:hypothetical protein